MELRQPGWAESTTAPAPQNELQHRGDIPPRINSTVTSAPEGQHHHTRAMTYLAYKRLTTRRLRAKIEARNQQRRTLKELAERRGDTPAKNQSPGKAKTRLELRALAPTLQGSADAFTWFRDRTTKAAPNGRGWYFLTAEGWTEFGPPM